MSSLKKKFKLKSILPLIILFSSLLSLISPQEDFNNPMPYPETYYPKNFLSNDNKSEIFPNLPWIAHKLCYNNKLISNFQYINFRTIESEDLSFRVNIITTYNDSKEIDITVGFRGTKISFIKNILADIDLEKIEIGGKCGQECFVHKGFYDAYITLVRKLYVELIEEIETFDKQGVKINNLYFTGHSLGGAMATIGAYDFLNKRALADSESVLNLNLSEANYKYLKVIKYVSLISFGCPRVGDKKFRAFMNQENLLKDSIRVVYGDDIVPALLVGKPLSNYRHIGDLAYFADNEFEYPVVYNRTEINKFTEPEKSLIDVINIKKKIDDHRKYYLINPKGIEFAIKYLRP